MRLAYDYSGEDAPTFRNSMDVLTYLRTGKCRHIFDARIYRNRTSGNPGDKFPVQIKQYGYNPTKECE